MSTNLVVRVLCCLPLCGAAAGAGTIFPYPYHRDVLPNGLTVYVIPMESPGLVAYYSVVRTGSRDEVEPGKTGFAHFFEHMMFRGTRTYPGPVYDSIMTSIGADANAYTTDDYTCYHLNFAREDLERVMELESDRFRNLEYDKTVFQTEAGAVYGEYRKNITNPYALLNEKMQELAYDVHTYKHTTMGFEADIKAMPEAFEYSRSFFRRFYRPENTVLLIVGDVDGEGVMKLVRKYYAGWERGYEAPQVTPEPPQKGARSAEVSYAGRTLPILNMAWKGDPLDPSNRGYVAALLLGDLAFGENSDLYRKLVIQDQTVQFIGAGIPANRDAPLFEVYSMVKKEEDVPLVRDAVIRTLEEFRATPVARKKLDDLKRRNKYGFLMGLDTPDNVAGGLARFVAVTGGLEVVEGLYAAMETVTPEDIMQAAHHYFTPERSTTIVLKGARQ
ncbi:MAG: pitrilysin family protein [Bacteroidota bacterium]